MNISNITPIKNGMNKEEAAIAIQKFLQTEVLKPENELHVKDIIKNEIVQTNGIGRMFQLVTFVDGSQWVPAFDGIQRFIGALYLKKALEHHKLIDFCAVETKFILQCPEETITITIKRSQDEPLKNLLTINSKNFISLSRYVGDKKPELTFPCNKFNLRKLTGFRDFMANANLRIRDGDNKVTVIDTEYNSFSSDDLENISPQEIDDTTFIFLEEKVISY